MFIPVINLYTGASNYINFVESMLDIAKIDFISLVATPSGSFSHNYPEHCWSNIAKFNLQVANILHCMIWEGVCWACLKSWMIL